jgi:hypothetical protein
LRKKAVWGKKSDLGHQQFVHLKILKHYALHFDTFAVLLYCSYI